MDFGKNRKSVSYFTLDTMPKNVSRHGEAGG